MHPHLGIAFRQWPWRRLVPLNAVDHAADEASEEMKQVVADMVYPTWTMSATLTELELETICRHPSALRFRSARPPSSRACRAACLAPGTLHRVIAAAQKTILASGMLAVGPSPKHGKSDAIRARANRRR